MSSVTVGNKKSTAFNLKCAASGQFLADATSDFAVIAVTYKPSRALPFTTDEAAKDAQRFMKSLYGSYDWQPVPAQV